MADDNVAPKTEAVPAPVTKKRKSLPRSKLVKYVDRLAEELRGSLAKSFEGDEDAIHDARVATRRLKAVVDLFEGHLSKRLTERFSKSLKRIRRTLGHLRDLDVIIEHIQSSKKSGAEAEVFLLSCLKREREQELEKTNDLKAAKILGKLGSWWGLREQIKDSVVLALLHESMTLRLEQFCRQANLQSGIHKESENRNAANELNPHELRIIGKALRYTVEMAVEEGVKIPAPVMQTFKRMQDLLGLWHDHVVLTGKVLEICVDEQLSYTQPALLKKNLTFALSCARCSDKRLKDFFTLWEKQGAEINEQITSVIKQMREPNVDSVPAVVPAEKVDVAAT